MRPVVAEEYLQGCDCNATVVGSIHTRVSEIFIVMYIYLHFFALVSRQSKLEFCHSTRNVSKNWAESGEQSVLTLSSLCLTCCGTQR